jgi:UDPglucose--hexose-1-phosphate uridylyltransferase
LETARAAAEAAFDPACYLCPGNERAWGQRNPDYQTTFVFDNDFAALRPDASPADAIDDGIFAAQAEPGICRVVCFSPRHDLTLARMPPAQIRPVVDTWVEQWRELAAVDWIGYVQVFENRGEMMGASNPHPHCQIWAGASIPNEVEKERRSQAEWLVRGRCLLCDYLAAELASGERVVHRNLSFAAVVPFWAVWPFELLVISTRHFGGFAELSPEERDDLAEILHRITAGYDNLFGCSFPYTMGFHASPADGAPDPGWHFHAHYYPPLLRSATVRKFMVGYEMLAAPQRDLTPEAAAARLRECAATPR